MANYNWRVTDGDFGAANNWTPSGPPGTGDVATFAGAGGGRITGAGNVGTLTLNSTGGAVWTFAGQVSAAVANVSSATALAAGAKLTVRGKPNNPFLSTGGTLNAPVTLTGATLDSSTAVLNIGAPYVALSGAGADVTVGGGSTATVLGANIGNGATGRVDVNGGSLSSVINKGLDTQSYFSGYLNVGQLATYNGVTTAGNGTLAVSNGGSVSIDRGLDVGRDAGSTGTVTASSGGVVTTTGSGSGYRTYLGSQAGGTGSLTINAGSTFRNTGPADTSFYNLVVGNAGASGGAPAASGTVLVSGAGALLDEGQNATVVGSRGNGSLTVSAGGTARSASSNSRYLSALAVADAAGSSGTVTVTGTGASYTAAGFVGVGRAGSGTLVVDQGGSFTGGQAPSGDGQGVNRSAAVEIGSGSPAKDPNGNPFPTVYYGGTGTGRVLNGSTLHSLGSLSVGSNGSTGTLLVDSGSTASADRFVNIGVGSDRAGGNGTLTVQGGGTVRSGGQHLVGLAAISIGDGPGNTGTVTVTGNGSLLDANGDRISVGTTPASGTSVTGTGSGTLSVRAGGTVLSGAAYADIEAAVAIGGGANETGTVTVADAGSRLLAAGLAVLGGNNSGSGLKAGGTGTLSATNGGFVQVGGLALFGGSSITVDGSSTGVVGGSAGTAGLLTVDAGAAVSGAGAIHATVRDQGSITAQGGTLTVGAVDGAGTGTLAAGSGATLDLLSSGGGGQALQFAGSGATIRLHAVGGGGASAVTGFAAGDVLDFADPSVVLALSGNVLTATANGALAASYTLSGLPGATLLTLAPDGTGGTSLTASNDATAPAGGPSIQVQNTSSGAGAAVPVQSYSGPVAGLQYQYINLSSDNLNVAAALPNMFIHTGAGVDAIDVSPVGGTNVLDGGTNSNFLVGGTGPGSQDTFFVDDRGAAADIWSTVANFHAGDAATVWGITAQDFALAWTDNEGAQGYTGLTLHASADGKPNASLTLAGYSTADLANGRLATSFGTVDGNNYLYVQATG